MIKCLPFIIFMILLLSFVKNKVLPQPMHKHLRFASFVRPLEMVDNDYEVTDFENTTLRKSRIGRIPVFIIHRRPEKDRQLMALERLFDENDGMIYLTKPRVRNILNYKTHDAPMKLRKEWEGVRRAVDAKDSETGININLDSDLKTAFDFGDLVT